MVEGQQEGLAHPRNSTGKALAPGMYCAALGAVHAIILSKVCVSV